MSLTAPQPAPLPSSAAPVWPLVIADASERLAGPSRPLLLADMEARDVDGRAKYGVPLTAGNGRDHLVDAYQEELDRAVYYRAEIEEGDPSGLAVRLYAQALDTLLLVRGALDRRHRARRATVVALLDAGAPLPVEALNAEAWPEVATIALTSTCLDSLAAVEVAMAIEDALELDGIPDADLQACVTVGDLARAAERAMGARR